MDGSSPGVRARIIPAILTAVGVMLLTAGLLEYVAPVEALPDDSDPPTVVSLPPSPGPSTDPGGSGGPSAGPTDAPSTTTPVDRVATRVVVPALGIDLPVIDQPDPSYPACGVAMYLKDDRLGQPGQGRATYLYAHAREGMFLAILDASKVENGARMLGMIVQVYTSDDRLFLYEITEVRRHQKSLDDALGATSEQLWLQTSEGPKAPEGQISPKTQVLALPFSDGPADPAEAHPVPQPVDCS